MAKKKRKMRARVEKIILPVTANDPAKAQISVDEADDLFKEIRVESVVIDERGKEHRLKPGDQVDVTIESDEAEAPKES